MLGREAIRQLGVPVVHVRGEIVEKQQGQPTMRAEAPVREPNVSNLDKLRGSGFMSITGIIVYSSSGFKCAERARIDFALQTFRELLRELHHHLQRPMVQADALNQDLLRRG